MEAAREARLTDCWRETCLEEKEGTGDRPRGMMAGKGTGEGKLGEGRPDERGE